MAPAPEAPPGPQIMFGSIQYLINISVLGAIACILLFLIVKLRDDHGLPIPSALFNKLLAVWSTTDQQVSRLCGVDASDYLAVQRYVFLALAVASIPGLLVVLPVNLYGGNAEQGLDALAKTTASHVRSGSGLFWVHVAFTAAVCLLLHHFLVRLEHFLHSPRLTDLDPLDTISAFTIMIRGVPRGLAQDSTPLMEYMEHLYPGKVYSVVVPEDLSTFFELRRATLASSARREWARAKATVERSFNPRDGGELGGHYRELASGLEDEEPGVSRGGSGDEYLEEALDEILRTRGEGVGSCWGVVLYVWRGIGGEELWRRRGFLRCGFALEWLEGAPWVQQAYQSVRRWLWVFGTWTWAEEVVWLEGRLRGMEEQMEEFRQQRARGSGLAFVVFKDVFTATRALRDLSWGSRRTAPELATWRWMVERAPPPGKVKWAHVGTSRRGRRLRSMAVNVTGFTVLLFWSSPLAMLTALNTASSRLDPETMEHFHQWLAWAQGSSWLSAIIFQFTPNWLNFVTMYMLIPAALSRCSKFERHLTVSAEAASFLIKLVFFLLVNLIVLRAFVETTLQSAITHWAHCYINANTCRSIADITARSFVATASLSALAFLISASLLGVSFDLVAFAPWMRRKFRYLSTLHSVSSLPSLVQRPTPREYPPLVPAAPCTDGLGGSRLPQFSQNLSVPGGRIPDRSSQGLAQNGEDQADRAVRVESMMFGGSGAREGEMGGHPHERVEGQFSESVSGQQRGLMLVESLEDDDDGGSSDSDLDTVIHYNPSDRDLEGNNGEDDDGEDLMDYPPGGPRQRGWMADDWSRDCGFDFGQYHAFNIATLAMTLCFSAVAPLVLPFGALYFGYRYMVDKYNFLFMYRLRGATAASDGRLTKTVVSLMRGCMLLFLLSMLTFFVFRGDDNNFQAFAVLVMLAVVLAKYGVETTLAIPKERGLDVASVQSFRNVEEHLLDKEVAYEVLSKVESYWPKQRQ